jgi:hypothetical protein
MALARCEQCGIQSERTKRTYSGKRRFPLSYPQSGVICGSPRCENQGAIWLTPEEQEMYEKGKRIFSMDTNTAKVQLQ